MTLLFRLILVLHIFLPFNKIYGQQRDSIQNSTLGIHFFANDHFSGNSFKTYTNSAFDKIFPGLALSFTRGITKHVDWNVMVYGTFADSILKYNPPVGKKEFFVDANFSIRAKMFPNVKRLQPFLQAGIGVSQYKSNTGFFIPVGAGLQINVFQDVFLTLQTKYSLPVHSAFRGYFSHSFGVSGVIGKPKRRKVQKVITVSSNTVYVDYDKDRDGILDSVDVCPDMPGLLQFFGCPDRDKDGVEDKVDHCPDVPGEIKYQGCPVPDTDQDGILDHMDKCIEIPGVVEYQGCPIPDRDKDGVRDQEDNCPDIFGSASSSGCPEIQADIQKRVEIAARNIFFQSGSYVLLPKSFNALDEVVRILLSEKNLQLKIHGHTDNEGDSTINQLLSEQRAKAVLDYLSNKGIEKNRLHASGFGEQMPIAENTTPMGRASNRRVDLKLYYQKK